MPQPASPRGRRTARALALALAGVLCLAGAAFAAVGLTNGSFEDGLNGWTAETVREGIYETEPAVNCQGIGGDPKRAICVTGADTFAPAGGTPVTVTPLDGTKMARLGGPFTSKDEHQFQDRYRLRQTFTVDAANPVLNLNYNVFLFDYQGFDELRFTVQLTDEDNTLIADFAQGGFGASGNTDLKTTGWRSAFIDLNEYAGQQVHLMIDSGGTLDDQFGFWAYVDAGEAQAPPLSPPTLTPPPGVPYNTFTDPATGQTFVAVPRAEAAACTTIDIAVPIDPGAGTVSNVKLIADIESGTQTFDMTQDGNVWRTSIPCETGNLAVQYTLTEGADQETFLVPIGGITLIDPAGVIYDIPRYDAARAAGQSEAQAHATAAIEGASVRLQRRVAGTFRNVLSGDPGISPNINPEITAANGQFQWDVVAGDYRVVVSKDGYQTTTSREVTIPDPVTDLHVGLQPTAVPQPPDDDGDGVPNASDSCPNTAASTANGCPAQNNTSPPPPVVNQAKPKPCAGLTGVRLATCQRKVKLDAAIAKCRQGRKSKRPVCIKRAKALSKCSAIKQAKKRSRCTAKARRIGRS